MASIKSKKVLLGALLVLVSSVMSGAASSAMSPLTLSTGGNIRYSSPDCLITLDKTEVIGNNEFSLGFFLDGVDAKSWRDSSQLRGLAQEANFKLVALFEHRLVKPCSYWNEDDSSKSTWDWSNFDLLVRRIFEIGGEPLIILGFYSWTYNSLTSAPSGMNTNWNNTNLPSPETWAAYCAEWPKHFEEVGLPVRYYEIFHEPHHYFGWGGSNTTRLGYFMDCFNSAARSMRAVNSNVLIGNDNSMVLNVLNYMINHGTTLDFLSWHAYISDNQLESDTSLIDKAEHDEGVTYGPASFIDTARKTYYDARGVWLPVIQSGANLNYQYSNGTDPRIQEMLNAITESLRLKMYVLKQSVIYSVYYNFASSGASSEKFGMVNLDNNSPWYPYYAYQIIGSNLKVNDPIISSNSSSNDVSSLAWINNGQLNILLICKVKQPRSVSLVGVTGNFGFIKIDESLPTLQKGTISSTKPVSINGYTLMLLQAEA